MADNIEKSAAEAMAGSQSKGTSYLKDLLKFSTLSGNNRNNSGSNSGSSSSSSSSTVGGQGTTGNGWTAEDYKNHNEYKENENRRLNETADNDVTRHVTKSSHDITLDNASKDAEFTRQNTSKDLKHLRKESQRNNDVTRNNTILENAKNNGQVSSIDVDHKSGRQQIRFNDSPVRETNPGNGAGNQGGSTQQGQPGGKRAPAGKRKPREKSPFETRYRDEDAKGSQDYLGTTLTAKDWAVIDKKERRDVANSYVTKGDKLTPAQKRQNTAARSYATPFKPGTTAGQAKTAATKPRGKKA